MYIKKPYEIENIATHNARVEDYFDLNTITKQKIISITSDMRIFFQMKYYESYDDFIKRERIYESADYTLPITKLKNELKKLGFKSWQISSQTMFNKNRVAILYVDISQNTDIIKTEMESFSWDFSDISKKFKLHGEICRMMTFDPSYPHNISKDVFKYNYIYYITPKENLSFILDEGLLPKCENDAFKYKPKLHLIKDKTSKDKISYLGWQLYNETKKNINGEYVVLRISVNKLSKNLVFYGDTRCEYGITTRCLIPVNTIELFGETKYINKELYNFEKINIFVENDTLK